MRKDDKMIIITPSTIKAYGCVDNSKIDFNQLSGKTDT